MRQCYVTSIFYEKFDFMRKKNFGKKISFIFDFLPYVCLNLTILRLPNYKERQITPWNQYWRLHWDHMDYGVRKVVVTHSKPQRKFLETCL